jgi:nicotinate phosphoribosyltransferase
VDAIPEGTVVFPNEPLLQVRGPLIEAQMVETFLLAVLNHQTLIATKAARVVGAAAGKGVIDFGARRAHGFDAAIYGARAAVIGGCIGTSNVLAGQRFGIPVYGTAAHSFTMAFAHETDAFRAFQRVFPDHATLLIDTYDTLEGARRAASLGVPIRGVRLDSGDLLALSRQVRDILDQAGLQATLIVASGDLNEDKIAALHAAGAPVDLYGVGTDLMTSRDAPALGGVYKLVAVDDGARHRPVRKLSPEKATYPDAKQVFRRRGPDGKFSGDVLDLKEGAGSEGGEPLLQPVIRGGRLEGPLPALGVIQARALTEREALPEDVRRLVGPAEYPVRISDALRRVMETMHPER